MKIALIHDWFRVNAGSEKVIKEMINTFSEDEVEVYTLFNKLPVIDQKEIIGRAPIHTTVLQYFPYINTIYQYLLPVLPFFIQLIKPRSADMYISSSHAVAKGFRLKLKKNHICYCHTPMRYAWFMHNDYLNDVSMFKKSAFKFVIPFIRKWDLRTAEKVDYFIANSQHIQSQIKNIYGRESVVIYPPVQVNKFCLNISPRKDFYLAVGRFVSYKKINLVIEAFQQMKDTKLVLIGNGHDAEEIKLLIKDYPNIVWLGYQHDDELILYMQNAKACIFAAKEDFGIMCVEAQATGTPVLAYNYGGYKETIIDGETGYFFDEQTSESIIEVVQKFEQKPLVNFEEIRNNTLRFSADRFRKELDTFVKECMLKYNQLHG